MRVSDQQSKHNKTEICLLIYKIELPNLFKVEQLDRVLYNSLLLFICNKGKFKFLWDIKRDSGLSHYIPTM